MDKFFKVTQRGSSIQTEVIGGLVTFFAMAYIIFVNPSYLSATGMDYYAVVIATCISSAIGCFLTAFIANLPFAQAPGMGLNAFFTYSICFGMGYTWQQALAIVLLSGLLFLAIVMTPARRAVVAGMPPFLRSAISSGVGLFIAFIGFINAGVVIGFGEGLGVYTDLGDITHGTPLLALIGLVLTAIMLARKVRGAICIGIVVTTIIGIPMGLTVYNPMPIEFSRLALTAGQFSFSGLLDKGVLALITAILSFALVDMFDTAGAVVSMAGRGQDTTEVENIEGASRVLIADAIATCFGALLGTSTVTTYIESGAGISEGAKTGLANVVTGILFIAALFLAPIAGMIPAAATAPALIIVGVFMMQGAAEVDWSNFEQAAPAFLAITMMPFTYSISNGIAFGFISYVLIKLALGKAREVPLVMYIVSALFVAMFILTGIGG